VGFFQDEQVALVQTPQSFYNPDPIAHNLGLEDILIPEEEVFYRQIQPIRDGAGGVICAGTSFVVRRSALNEVGGFVTDSLSEDYFTGIRLAARGYQLLYLDEKLSEAWQQTIWRLTRRRDYDGHAVHSRHFSLKPIP
jgi:cellulose synthase (UDP-forming)